jgi:predicted flap endonuclease-1-like 5' DNA nuclease
MPNPAHIIETALLILVAFLIGATIGALARRLTLPRRQDAAVTVETMAVPAGPQLVTAPTIVAVDRKRARTSAERLAAAGAADAEPPVAMAEASPPPERPVPQPAAGQETVSGLQATVSMPEVVLPAFSSVPARQPAHVAGKVMSAPSPAVAEPVEEPAPPVADTAAEAPLESVAPAVMPEPADAPVRAEDVPPIDETMQVIERFISAAIAADPKPASEPTPVSAAAPAPTAEDLFPEPLNFAEPVPDAPEPVLAPVPLDAPAAELIPEPAPEAGDPEPALAATAEAVDVLPISEPELPLEPVPEPETTTEAITEPEPEPPEAAAEPPRPASDTALFDDAEAAAMRAIEGRGWLPRPRVAPTRPVAPPELSPDVDAAMASARSAVAAATAAAEAAIADAEPAASFEPGPAAQLQSFLDGELAVAPVAAGDLSFETAKPHLAFGRPEALPAPRGGSRDNLKQIKGMTPALESSLNELGIFHFDQIAAWDPKAVVWMDGHLALKGRIGRERWLEQARDLSRGRGPQPARPLRR